MLSQASADGPEAFISLSVAIFSEMPGGFQTNRSVRKQEDYQCYQQISAIQLLNVEEDLSLIVNSYLFMNMLL